MLITHLRPVPRFRRSGVTILHFFVVQQPKSAFGHLSVEVSRSHTPGRTPLNRRSALHRGHYPHNTQQKQKTNTYAFSGVRILNPSNRRAVELPLRWSYTSTPPYAFMMRRATTLSCLVMIPCSLATGDQYFGITGSLHDQCR
jgi:hypothetical protein